MEKTLMVLGDFVDSRTQKLLSEAKELGLRIILCVNDGKNIKVPDYYPSAVCFSDWNDHAALIEIAKKERIDGVVCVSDPGVLASAAVSAALGLRGSSEESVRNLMFKASFRRLQQKAGVFCPQSFLSDNVVSALQAVQALHFPVIIKPLLSSSSHGQSVLSAFNEKDFTAAFENAETVSRNGQVCIEEFIENPDNRIFETEVFLMDGNCIFEGARDSYRSEKYVLRPVCDVYPSEITPEQREKAEDCIRRVLLTSGATFGHFNAEGFFTRDGHFFIVEINPRLPGYYNCDHIQLHSGLNMVKLLITAAVGNRSYYEQCKSFRRENRFILSHTLFSNRTGVFQKLFIDPKLEKLIRQCMFISSDIWPYVYDIFTAESAVVKLAYEFDSREQLDAARKHLDELIFPVVI